MEKNLAKMYLATCMAIINNDNMQKRETFLKNPTVSFWIVIFTTLEANDNKRNISLHSVWLYKALTYAMT